MRYETTGIEGAFLLVAEPQVDERGLFARTVDTAECRKRGLAADWVQCSTSFNRLAGTLRGLHFQVAPHSETKLVRCTRGSIYDVAVDLRPRSATQYCWVGAHLTADNRNSLYVPKGLAHGFLTLADETEVLYMMDAPYVESAARGVRWNDPAFGISWPLLETEMTMTDRDRSYAEVGTT